MQGGATRTDSVLAGVSASPEDAALVAVHDGARPLVSDKVITDAVRAAAESGAARPLFRSRTASSASKTEKSQPMCRAIRSPPSRRRRYSAGNCCSTRCKAAAASGRSFTDDCAAVEALGQTVSATEGSYENIKVTTPEDILVAEAFMHREAAE